MIYEFAVDPELVATWYDRAAYRFFDGKFGKGQRRILCRYPAGAKWRDVVWEAFQRLMKDADGPTRQSAKSRLDALVRHLEQGATARSRGWNGARGWKPCALDEHALLPFQGILVRTRSYVDPADVLAADDLDEASGTRWNPEVGVTARVGTELVAALRPVLRCCRHIRLVDPYLDLADPSWAQPVSGILASVYAGRPKGELPVVEVHTAVDRVFRGPSAPIRTPSAEAAAATRIVADCEVALLGWLPAGSEARVYVWRQSPQATPDFEYFHNRCVLTDVGGISFGHGLDVSGKGTDDLTLLSRQQVEHRWQQFTPPSKSLELVSDKLVRR